MVMAERQLKVTLVKSLNGQLKNIAVRPLH